MRTKHILPFLLIIILSFSSCVVQQGLNMSLSQNGWATTDLYVDNFFLEVLEDFEPFYEEQLDKSILDTFVDDFIINLQGAKSASAIEFIKINPNSYFIDFNFSSLANLLDDLNKIGTQEIVKITQSKNETTLNFNLNLNNYPQLVRMVPFLGDPNFETFGPLYNEGMSKDEYYEMISYILGSQGPESIKNSLISIRLTVPKSIKHQTNGFAEGINSIRFDIPLIDFLLLDKPILFSVTW
ncbi:MAG: hypothetical protein WDA17_01640 [Sphaerochaetaceae bacterium]